MTAHAKAAPAGPDSGSRGVQLPGEHTQNTQPDAHSQDGLVGDLQKNRREVLRIQLRTYKGVDLPDVRVHFPDDTGELRPTGKGVSIKPGLIPELIALLQTAENEAHRR